MAEAEEFEDSSDSECSFRSADERLGGDTDDDDEANDDRDEGNDEGKRSSAGRRSKDDAKAEELLRRFEAEEKLAEASAASASALSDDNEGGVAEEKEEDEQRDEEEAKRKKKEAEEAEEAQEDDEVASRSELEAGLTDAEVEERRQSAQSLKSSGNRCYQSGDYAEAERLYTAALAACPIRCQQDRSVLYANRAACRLRRTRDEGDDDDDVGGGGRRRRPALADCDRALRLNPRYVKCRLRRAELRQADDDLDGALEDFSSALELDPDCARARAACQQLPAMISEKNERLKREMLGQLKQLGNMVLRPFGLSTDNFQLQQDPDSGGYSVQFVKQ